MSSRGGRPLALRFVLYFAITYLLLIGATGFLVSRSVENAFTERLLDNLESAAMISGETMPSDPDALGEWVEALSSAGGYRFTVIAPDGVVLADSHADAATAENHADRPEVAAAIAGEPGRTIRTSETTGFEQLYVAVPTAGAGVLRLSAAARELAQDTWPYRSSIILIAVLIGLAGLALITWMAMRMSEPISRLTRRTLALADGEPGPGMERTGLREIDQLSSAVSRLDAESRDRLAQARRASDTLEIVLGALPQGTLLFGEEDDVVYSNPSAHQLLGAVPDSLAGLIPFPLQTAVEQCRELRAPFTIDAEHGRPVRLLRAIATPFADDRRVLLVVVDVTEQERSASVRRDFVANASHELKTPVASIISSAEALQMAVERGDSAALRFNAQIETSARHLDRLVADLLDLSRLERDRPELEPLDLHHLVQEEVERARSDAAERGVSIELITSPNRVAGSRRDLSIALRNLLDNALRHTPEGGSITVTLESDGGAVLRVADTGEGIPSRDLERIFERFYRVDEARARATGGTGLGLAIVKHVVESHGGEVDVESELGAGSTFTVRLPLLSGQAMATG